MNMDELFDFKFDKYEKCWTVTGYYGSGEDVVLPVSYKGKPVKKIGDEFSPYNKRIKHVTVPEGYTSIGALAFQKCTGLTNIELPESLTSVGALAFDNCTRLTNIKLPKNLISIEAGAFENCKRLKNVELPISLVSIGDWAFKDCTGLTNIKLPKNLTSIGDEAFLDCTGLTEITLDIDNPVFCSVDGAIFDKTMTTLILFHYGKEGIYYVPDEVTAIEYGAFCNCKLTSIYFPKSLLIIEGFEFNGYQLTEINVSEFNPVFCNIDGVLFDKEKQKLMVYPRNKEKTEYAVPDGIKYIDGGAFCGCKRLVNIVLPESLEIIGDGAFEKCEKLKAITLPMSLRYIGKYSFADCPNLETVTLSRKTMIGQKAFWGFEGKLVYRD